MTLSTTNTILSRIKTMGMVNSTLVITYRRRFFMGL